MSMLSALAFENPVVWSVACNEIDAEKVEVSITAQIEEGWHLYSQHQNGMALPLVFKTTDNEQCTWLTDSVWKESPAYTEEFNALFNENERFLSGTAIFTTTIQRLTSDAFTANVQVEGQACKILSRPMQDVPEKSAIPEFWAATTGSESNHWSVSWKKKSFPDPTCRNPPFWILIPGFADTSSMKYPQISTPIWPAVIFTILTEPSSPAPYGITT